MTTKYEVISGDEFSQRLVAICGGGPLTALPKRQRDVAIVLAAAALWMEHGAVYSEKEINEGLQNWLDTACSVLSIDAVTLRRELVDRHYLDRDDAGRHYSPGQGPTEWRFADDVARIDPKSVVEDARAEREQRKRQHLGSSHTDNRA